MIFLFTKMLMLAKKKNNRQLTTDYQGSKQTKKQQFCFGKQQLKYQKFQCLGSLKKEVEMKRLAKLNERKTKINKTH